MKLVYQWDSSAISIQEAQNGNDVEFTLELHDSSLVDAMRQVQKSFDANTVITDVLFYAYHKYRVIVRNDYYHDFILELIKFRLISRVEWQ
jgi:hypothetical protein